MRSASVRLAEVMRTVPRSRAALETVSPLLRQHEVEDHEARRLAVVCGRAAAPSPASVTAYPSRSVSRSSARSCGSSSTTRIHGFARPCVAPFGPDAIGRPFRSCEGQATRGLRPAARGTRPSGMAFVHRAFISAKKGARRDSPMADVNASRTFRLQDSGYGPRAGPVFTSVRGQDVLSRMAEELIGG